MTSKRLTMGVDIGGSKVLVILADEAGEKVGRALGVTPQAVEPRAFWEGIQATCGAALESAGAAPRQVVGVGLALAGAVDQRERRTAFSPYSPAMETLDLGAAFERWLGVTVAVDNDANMAALGERWFGAARGVDDFVYLTLSTGFGAGIVAGGRLLRGARGYAGEPGSLCPAAFTADGSPSQQRWQPTCTGSGIAMSMGLAVGARRGEATAEAVFVSGARGEPVANLIIDDAARQLGVSLTRIVDLLDPELLVVGGGLTNRWDKYVGPAIEFMLRESFAAPLRHVRVAPAQLGVESGCWGAIGCAWGMLEVADARA